MNQLDEMMTEQLTLEIDPTNASRILVHGATVSHLMRIKSIPGARYVGLGQDFWSVPTTWVAVNMMRRYFGAHLTWGDNLTAWCAAKWESQIEPALKLRENGAEDEWCDPIRAMSPACRQPFDYQVAGAIYLATARRAMLLDQQGTGKMTQTALTLSLYPETLPALIIAPKSVIYTWQYELGLFGVKSMVVDGSAEARRKTLAEFEDDPETQVLITSYGVMTKHSRVAGYGKIKLSAEDKERKELNQTPWATVCCDEGHRLMNPETGWTRACWAVSEHAPFRWVTTGTPTESNLVDFWALLHFIDPDEWPSKTKYIDAWIMTYQNHFGGLEVLGLRPDTEPEFRAITDWHMRRVTKAEVLTLPPVATMQAYGVLSAKERAIYKAMEKTLMAEVGLKGTDDTSVLFAENHMVKAGRLRMAAQGTLVFDEEKLDSNGYPKISITEPSSKLDLLKERLEDYDGQPCILWFTHRDLLAMQAARFDKAEIPYLSITGDVTGYDRTEAVRRFQMGEVDYILCMTQAAGEGVTLTRAPVAIWVEQADSSIQMSQSPDRNVRIGSEIHDQIVHETLIMRGTVEELQVEKLREKGEAAQELLRD